MIGAIEARRSNSLDRLIRKAIGIWPFIFSFETAFVLFLFAGRFKADPRLEWVPIDLTALFFGISVVAGVFILLKRRLVFPRLGLETTLLLLAFIAWMALSLAWTPGSIYAMNKTFFMATLVLWAFLGTALIIANDEARLKRFYILILLFGILVTIESLVYYLQATPGGFLQAFGSRYLAIARTLGLSISVALIAWLYANQFTTRSLAFVVLLLSLYVTFVAGARGPLIATALALLVPLVASWRMTSTALGLNIKLRRTIIVPLISLLILSAAGIAFLIDTGRPGTTLVRFYAIFTLEGGEPSAIGRLLRLSAAIDQWAQSPIIGQGVGSFPVLAGFGDVREYPHNIVLETLSELGVVGLVLLILPFGLVFLKQRTLMPLRSPYAIVAVMFFVNTLTNAMVSGDISDNRLLFMSLGLLTIHFGASTLSKQVRRSST